MKLRREHLRGTGGIGMGGSGSWVFGLECYTGRVKSELGAWEGCYGAWRIPQRLIKTSDLFSLRIRSRILKEDPAGPQCIPPWARHQIRRRAWGRELNRAHSLLGSPVLPICLTVCLPASTSFPSLSGHPGLLPELCPPLFADFSVYSGLSVSLSFSFLLYLFSEWAPKLRERKVEESEGCCMELRHLTLLWSPLRIEVKTLVRIDQGIDDKLIEVRTWKGTLEVGRAVKFLFGKGRDVTASKQDIGILALFSGTALGQALGWMGRRLIVGLSSPFTCSWSFYPAAHSSVLHHKTMSGMLTERLL